MQSPGPWAWVTARRTELAVPQPDDTQGPLDNAARRAHSTERYQGGVVDPQKQGDPDPGYNMDDLGGRWEDAAPSERRQSRKDKNRMIPLI